MIRAFILAACLTLLLAAPAAADPVEITAQAKAARAEFLLTATPPGPAATICLVDTGVNVESGHERRDRSPRARGEPSDQSPTLPRHGDGDVHRRRDRTASGWSGSGRSRGSLSVRANVAGQDTFTPAGYINGVKRCSDAAPVYGVKVVGDAVLSALALTPEESAALADEVDGARRHGTQLRRGGGATTTAGRSERRPTSQVFSASARSTPRLATCCSFSATGACSLAPGCTLDGADPASGARDDQRPGHESCGCDRRCRARRASHLASRSDSR